MLKLRELKMIEMRIIKHEDTSLEIQYRYKTDYHGVMEWSEWETAPYLTPSQVRISSLLFES